MAQSVRLYTKGRFLGFKRGKRNQYENTSLIRIEGVSTKEETDFYLGKRVAFVTSRKGKSDDDKVNVIWGRITRSHGNSGIVRAKFKHNLPPSAMGSIVRVMMYPSNI
ncbi:60S ribosomal protein L35A [Mycoemilia scoparia]|uniref:60S ribosomal protein L35A n=1 Tax=Mycoemilia scoparia TaxID=417184 RepID=A0A9W8DV92_9FUNG|nr:60S ribosomal protein L35A [Mycoemilia scoparia]